MISGDKCGACMVGNIQHTSFMENDTIIHIYGCNRCSNWAMSREKSKCE